MSMSKVTPVGRASFPNLSRPDQFNKYSLSLLLLKSDPKVIEFVRWLKDAVTKEAMTIAGAAGVQTALSNFTNFKDGDNESAFNTYRSEYAGHYVLNVSRKTEYGKPCVVNRNTQPIDPSEIYAGCNVMAYIDVYGYKYGTKKGVSIGIQHVMKVGENTPLVSTGVKVEDAFAELDIPTEEETLMPQTMSTPPLLRMTQSEAVLRQTTSTSPAQTTSNPPTDPFSGV